MVSYPFGSCDDTSREIGRCGDVGHSGKVFSNECGGAGDKARTSPPRDILSLAIADISKDGPLTEQDKMTIVDQLKTFYFAGACSLDETTSPHVFPAQFLTVS